MHHQQSRAAGDRPDRSEVADDVKIQFVIKRRVPSVSRRGEMQHVAVGRRFGDSFRGESASGAGAIFDEELLAEMLRQPLADQACIGVVYTPWRKAGYDPNRMGRIAFCFRRPRVRSDRDGARCKTTKVSSGQSHYFAPALRNVQVRGYTVAQLLRSALRRKGVSSFQDADELGQPVCIILQRFGFAIVDDAAFVEDHRARRER